MKVTAQELDKIILVIPWLNRKQLDRLDTLVHQELLRKLDNGKATEKEATV